VSVSKELKTVTESFGEFTQDNCSSKIAMSETLIFVWFACERMEEEHEVNSSTLNVHLPDSKISKVL